VFGAVIWVFCPFLHEFRTNFTGMATRPPTRLAAHGRLLPAILAALCLMSTPSQALPLAARAAENDRMQAMMLSAEPKTRAAAHSVAGSWVKTAGDEGRVRYSRILWAAWQHGERMFTAEVREGAVRVGRFRTAYANWRALGREAVDAVHGELAESDSRLASLDERYQRANDSRAKVDVLLASAVGQGQRIGSVAKALAQIEQQINALEGVSSSKPLPTLRERLSGSLDGRAVLEAEPLLLAARELRDSHFEASEFNREQSWAPSSAKGFASLLNTHRRALGLEPMRLERQLWHACASHAEEMQRLGYFAHESPSPDRRTPDRRAVLADFGGSFEGENLFQSQRPQTPAKVFRSWWASDSHRYVLFSGRPNALGLDPGGGTHWALMTGRL
jgi:uncharacterized protein YkwD